MKKYQFALGFVIGFLLVAFIAASPAETVVITKPATPRHTIVKPFRAMFGIENDIAKYVAQKTKEGYVVKTIAIIDDEAWSKGVVVLEKY